MGISFVKNDRRTLILVVAGCMLMNGVSALRYVNGVTYEVYPDNQGERWRCTNPACIKAVGDGKYVWKSVAECAVCGDNTDRTMDDSYFNKFLISADTRSTGRQVGTRRRLTSPKLFRRLAQL